MLPQEAAEVSPAWAKGIISRLRHAASPPLLSVTLEHKAFYGAVQVPSHPDYFRGLLFVTKSILAELCGDPLNTNEFQ